MSLTNFSDLLNCVAVLNEIIMIINVGGWKNHNFNIKENIKDNVTLF